MSVRPSVHIFFRPMKLKLTRLLITNFPIFGEGQLYMCVSYKDVSEMTVSPGYYYFTVIVLL